MKKILTVLALVFGFPMVALAQSECTSDTDCAEGYQCMMALCACAPCPDDGSECEPCTCDETGVCVAITDDGGNVDDVVLPSECATDADCPADFACEAMEVGCAVASCPPCEAVDCPDGQECPQPECEPCDPMPEECAETTVNACVYHPVECAANSDCPADYKCEIYSTGGTVCTDCTCACPAEGECPPCECESTCEEVPGEEYGVCVPEEKSCTVDTDCPEGWSCEIVAYDAGCGCACAVPACDPDSGECEPVECPACECETPELPTSGYCYPAGWAEIAVDAAGSGEYTDEDGAVSPTAVVPVAKDGETLTAQESSTDGNTNAADGGESSSGCTTSTQGSPLASMMLAGLALALMALRRKVR